MSCACKRTVKKRYEWTNGTETHVYDSEMAAKAKVMRKGGSYKPVEG
jgi:hypothetical protein